MSNLSDIIESFIKNMITTNDNNEIEIQRNTLAQHFSCSPSQINYVLTTRFNNDRGYIIESKRGGGGYIKIFKINSSVDDELNKILNESIGQSITINKAYDLLNLLNDKDIISKREKEIMQSAISDRALSLIAYEDRNRFRAILLKEMILASLKDD